MVEPFLTKRYREYITNNPQGYWFKRKMYGWGWTPATWQGWVLSVVFIAIICGFGLLLQFKENPTGEDMITFFSEITLAVMLFIYICYKKGEKPRWQWGKQKD